MDEWRSIAERKIREAMEEGVFDNLRGEGQPLDLEENPYEDPSQRMGHRLLRNNGFAPAWMEEAKDIERDIELARSGRMQISEVNKRILAYNLKAPSAQFHFPFLEPQINTDKRR